MATSNANPVNKPEKGSNTPTRRRVRKSKLRKTEEALRKLEPKSLENIELSVNGKEVDKEVLTSSKWVLTTIMALGKAAAVEEELTNGTRLKFDEAEEQEAEKEEAVPSSRFSLHVLPKKDDL